MQRLLRNLQLVLSKNEDLKTELYIKYKDKKLVSKQDLLKNKFDICFKYIDGNLQENILDKPSLFSL